MTQKYLDYTGLQEVIKNISNIYTNKGSVVGAKGSIGQVKNGSSVTNVTSYIACPIVGGIPYYKDTNNTYTLGSFGITATATELNYCDGVTSNIQTQLNGKVSTSDSRLTNSRPASDVYAWAKSASKPSYSASEVGALPSSALDFWKGRNTVSTLASLPITKRSIVATVTSATNLSLSSNLQIGQELYIRVFNNSGSQITQPIPNSGSYVSMNGTSIIILPQKFIEISIWCYDTNKYSIRIGEIV